MDIEKLNAALAALRQAPLTQYERNQLERAGIDTAEALAACNSVELARTIFRIATAMGVARAGAMVHAAKEVRG